MLEEVLQQLLYQHLLLNQPTEHLQQGTVGPRQGILGVSISILQGSAVCAIFGGILPNIM